MTRHPAVIASFLVLSASVGMMADGARAEDLFRRLPTAEIRSKVAGMAITDEVHWGDRYNRDGTFVTSSMGTTRTGKWFVLNGELCTDDGRPPPDCFEVWLSGSKVEFRRPQGEKIYEGY